MKKMRRGLPTDIDHTKAATSLYEGIEYEEFWNDYPKRKLDELEHAIVRNLLPISGRRIIDVGCGYGRMADCYLGRFKQVIMVDGSMSLLHQAMERTRGQAIYIACDARKLPFRTASFDAVLMIRVFHHIQDSLANLSEMHRLLCDDGRFVFSYMNKRNALRIIRWMIGANRDNPFDIEPAGVGSTLISHHPTAVHRMMQESGFANMQYHGAGVLDRLAGRIGFTGRWIAAAFHLAPFFAWSKIAPWILCSATAKGHMSLVDSQEIGDLLQCPICGASLTDEKNGYQCLMCNTHYPIEDEIIDLRVQ